jgi:hypothetical protein
MKHFTWLPLILLTITIINYPNPFNPKGGEVATIECTTSATAEALLYIYDLTARRVWQQTFNLQGGTVKNRTAWNGYNSDNELVGTGVYLYRLVDAASKQSLGRGKIWVINK